MADKPFVFSLASVLQLREHESEQARVALGCIVRRRQEQQHHVQAAQERLTQLLSAGPTGANDPTTFRHFDAHCRSARRALEKAQAKLTELLAAEEAARTNVLLRHQAEEVLRTLQDEEAEVHREVVEQRTARILDEQAVVGYQRQRNMVGL